MTKATDIRFYWIQYQIGQGHYNLFWKPGATNLTEYFTKHNPTHNNRCMCSVLLLV